MSKILFHPDISVVEAARIANSQGGRLVWKDTKPRYSRAMLHNRRALAAIEAQDYEGALGHIRAARDEVEGGAPCAA